MLRCEPEAHVDSRESGNPKSIGCRNAGGLSRNYPPRLIRLGPDGPEAVDSGPSLPARIGLGPQATGHRADCLAESRTPPPIGHEPMKRTGYVRHILFCIIALQFSIVDFVGLFC
jgi:hypothetical protein